MTRTIDLNSKKWRDLIFAGKNQLYGAYEIRKTSTQRHLMSLGIVILLGATFLVFPMVMKKLFPAGDSVSEPPDGKITLAEYNLTEKDKEIIEMVKQAEAVPDLKSTIKFTPPVVRPDELVSEADEMPTQDFLSDAKPNISIATVEGVEGGTKDIADFNNINVIAEKSTETPVTFAEQMPYFPGGDKEMMSYLSKNIKYPIPAIETGTQGTVLLRFVVGKEGNIQDVAILRSLDPLCDKEAVRVVKSMPKWTPGRQNGNPVAVYYTLPVKFKLNN